MTETEKPKEVSIAQVLNEVGEENFDGVVVVGFKSKLHQVWIVGCSVDQSALAAVMLQRAVFHKLGQIQETTFDG